MGPGVVCTLPDTVLQARLHFKVPVLEKSLELLVGLLVKLFYFHPYWNRAD